MRALFVAFIAAVSITSTADAAALIEPLRSRAGRPAEACTADRAWCTTTARGSAIIRHRDARIVATLKLESNEEERVESTLWPSIVRVNVAGEPEFVLVGVERTQREAYSGGGGFVRTLTLFEVRPGANVPPRDVLRVPLESSFLIRACFSRADQRERLGACHDEYRYRASLTAPQQGARDIRLVYRARADSFPGRRNRFDDSTREGQLRKADLYRAAHPRCTFKRDLVRNAATGTFDWNAPPPDCREYLDLQ